MAASHPNQPAGATVYSIGHGNRSAAEFLAILTASGVACLADVRAYPGSRRHPQFARKSLALLLEAAGIGYHWLGKALGGFRQASPHTIHTALATDNLRAYADHMNSNAFRTGINQLLAYAAASPVAMLCAERLPQHCHRAMIADYLTANGIAVIHILSEEQRITHSCNPCARWDGKRLIYDKAGRQQLEWAF
jgi:uncharacterized protein (DUF488 family)